MDTEAEMEKPEERNDDEARAADEESLYLVQLGPSTPVQLEEGKLLVDVKDEELRYEYGISKNPYREENDVRVHQADQAHKDREAERKRVLVAAWSPIIAAVATVAIAVAVIVYRLT